MDIIKKALGSAAARTLPHARQFYSFSGNATSTLLGMCIEVQYRSKVWTHFFSFFKTAVEIGPVG